jgi:cell division protein FtsW
LAAWLEKKGEGIKDFYSGTIPFLFLNLVVLGLIILQPDMGTMVIVAMTAFIIFYLAGSKRIHLAGIGVSALIVIWILIKSAPYRMRRLLVFLKPEQVEGSAYHINQILIAIGSGGLLGLGFGQSRQKYLYLPQVHTDSIFAIIVEELGFLRAALILGVFVFFAWRGYRIARQAPDVFARLVATGITSWIIVQAFINIAAMLGIVPLTGVPLPFISFGGSSLVMCLAAIGILLNISKQSVE